MFIYHNSLNCDYFEQDMVVAKDLVAAEGAAVVVVAVEASEAAVALEVVTVVASEEAVV